MGGYWAAAPLWSRPQWTCPGVITPGAGEAGEAGDTEDSSPGDKEPSEAQFEWHRHFASMGTPGTNPSSPSVASDRSTYLDAADSTSRIAGAIDKMADAKAKAAESKALLYAAKQTKADAALIEAQSRAKTAEAQMELQYEAMSNASRQTDAVLALLSAVMNKQ